MTGEQGLQFIEPLPDALIATPLDYMLADHLRQRVLCHLCDRLADAGRVDRRLADEVGRYIAGDMARHVCDEENDFFPLLRRRARPDDEIDEVLAQLSGEHAEDRDLATSIVAGLAGAADDGAIPDDLRQTLRTFAHNERRHLALENAVVIPLARLRLSAGDLEELARRMAARRGIRLQAGGAG